MERFRTTIEIDHEAKDAGDAREQGEEIVNLFLWRDEVIGASVKSEPMDDLQESEFA